MKNNLKKVKELQEDSGTGVIVWHGQNVPARASKKQPMFPQRVDQQYRLLPYLQFIAERLQANDHY